MSRMRSEPFKCWRSCHTRSTPNRVGSRGIEMALKNRKIRDSYLELINELPLRKLRDAGEHRRPLAIFSRFASREKLDDGVIDYLDVLAGLIADYEQHASFAIDTSKVSAADVVRHLMQEND